ncbi:GNAT family N-acetyltransferase [Mariniphaga sediminis]|jgi:glutathione synthase/RimK-type ligase-like ATP-grasp enzyme/ribosomal protein S18 acetylase RimI-like enzyme|uniref:GNAT family N-acetyltransferase n=1 Tax=Mariniphaga sediminis TaxID=1628158 RepID=A0A399D2I2_9BACT|nr:GNAT family N-acetyltransferase [Mariniphaga sediminis]RIH64891.1 GNAT family N-acetyltransferase [Mariniphaga sediminis]
MKTIIRKSEPNDLNFLEELEKSCFPKFQQNTRRAIRYSMSSPFQQLIIAEVQDGKEKRPAGSATLYLYTKSLRIFSIAVLPAYREQGIGKQLMEYIMAFARAKKMRRISLEVRRTDEKVIQFYKNAGFSFFEELPDYYMKGEHGLRMVLQLDENPEKQSISNIIIVRNPKSWNLPIEGVKVISSRSYITSPEFQSLKNVRIFNLSNSYQYQKMGYYVSLLASARDHRVIPNVTTLRDFSSLSLIRSLSGYIDEDIQKTLKPVEGSRISIFVYFSQSVNPKFKQLAQKLYHLFEAPLLQIDFVKNEKWMIQKVTPLSMKKVNPDHLEKVQEFARDYFSKKRFTRPRFKNYKYDLAILVNPDEKNPPSCPVALQNFKKAAEKEGFYTEFITKDDFSQLSEFDALFIRETTSVNNHTYHFSRAAYAEGLVVIDDPWSIMRCSNKIFQNERLKQNKIKTPVTVVLSKSTYRKLETAHLAFPLVLKQPDSAFSLGVEKVTTPEELDVSLKKLFQLSDLVIVQEFMPSEFDWRIGVLDQAPLYACKYYMAKDHWQIYNWNSNNKNNWGNSETVPLDQVPEPVIKTAVKAASLIGDGLYGVDLKLVNNEVYVIEVNDNPNVDAGIEDYVLKDELYTKIVRSLFNRIEINRNIAQFVTV